ncbi:bifunctional 2-C-methyl-D-erythritol 4-phosphate cytidylyltransferase/2-C-methyl-D-erythritol 2,4-cyclodiphosphate synthase [Salaquimonas pukyongi]|uniref:bifunctional 2-C-methyl-D-erythritol 4-phosphate cytidylyltransferase/2-C-methyl-D-erythritol 2,4-cyclodiphosphate synthase n=1 Tax=Salaquimonas pukyongi TaxID=2712698 RepID=UPI00096B7EAC|nr:bifunctional 2-C-methyl-D-erythritol 4-phosphate cytidylyltransferase/2-C-methyl-D-erythritol 2,4-cyclodiphosphate synthase [Salaquimonas pukyongi]
MSGSSQSPAGFTAAIIVAAGRGSRMGDAGSAPKQYARLGGQSLLAHSCKAFLDHGDVAVVLPVIHPGDVSLFNEAVSPHPDLLAPVFGGATRQQSVHAGLKALAERETKPDTVLVHDAARPFISASTITAVLQGIEESTGALPGLAVPDTVKRARSDGLIEETLSRDGLYLAQTPQGFLFGDLLAAHDNAAAEGHSGFTDDAAVAEWAGLSTVIVPGNAENFKITTKRDLNKAFDIMQVNKKLDVKHPHVGHGYDVHRLVQGGPIVVCGIEIASKLRADGHSDADVGLHALTDALLGAICDGDIGSHFPPSDPRWKGASSDRFLAHACRLAREKDGDIVHLDVTLICEAPKIGPHRDAMRSRIAGICGLSASHVSVKATTHERIGTIGRGEGIAAMATATVMMPAMSAGLVAGEEETAQG